MTIDASKPTLAAVTTWAAFAAGTALGQCVYETAHLAPPNGAQDDQFGLSLDLEGDTLVVGATRYDAFAANAGAVFIFARAEGTWTLADLFAPDEIDPGASFGRSVSLENGTLAVGAIFDDVTGTVYIFEETEGGWSLHQKLAPDDLSGEDRFGVSVDLDGDTLVVGSHRFDDLGSNSGAAFVYERDDEGTWTLQLKLLASDGQAVDEFGQSVALRGDWLVAGAKWEDEVASNAGAAYVFHRVGETWVEEAKLTAADGKADDQFGQNVTVTDAWMSVASPSADGRSPDSGAAYMYRLEEGQWVFHQKVTASDDGTGDSFGLGMNVVGNTAVFSAAGSDAYGLDAGAAHVFVYDEGSKMWIEETMFVGSKVESGDQFGGVAFDGHQIAIAAIDADVGGQLDVGAVYAFDLLEVGECYPDFFPDCNLDIIDFVAYQNAYLTAQPKADCNGDGILNILDFVCYQGAFQAGCP